MHKNPFHNIPFVQRNHLPLALGITLLAAGLPPALYAVGLMDLTQISLFGKYLSFVVVAIGADLVWGYTGILTLCQAMFFCMGAYAMGMYFSFEGKVDANGVPNCLSYLSSDVHGATLPWFWVPFRYFPVALVLGMLIPACVAGIFGFFTFRSRVKGVYFSIITQAITLASVQFFMLNNMRLGGTNGVRLDSVRPQAGLDFYKASGILGMYVITVLVVALVYAFGRHLVNSRFGRVLMAIRDNESRLRFSGYQPAYYKMFIFAVAAAIGGIGGMLYIPQVQIITPVDMDAMNSTLIIVWVAFGGRGTLTGAIVGALAVNLIISKLTTAFPNGWQFVLGGLAIAVVLYFPQGLMGIFNRLMGMDDENARAVPPKLVDPEDPAEALPSGKEASA